MNKFIAAVLLSVFSVGAVAQTVGYDDEAVTAFNIYFKAHPDRAGFEVDMEVLGQVFDDEDDVMMPFVFYRDGLTIYPDGISYSGYGNQPALSSGKVKQTRLAIVNSLLSSSVVLSQMVDKLEHAAFTSNTVKEMVLVYDGEDMYINEGTHSKIIDSMTDTSNYIFLEEGLKTDAAHPSFGLYQKNSEIDPEDTLANLEEAIGMRCVCSRNRIGDVVVAWSKLDDEPVNPIPGTLFIVPEQVYTISGYEPFTTWGTYAVAAGLGPIPAE